MKNSFTTKFKNPCEHDFPLYGQVLLYICRAAFLIAMLQQLCESREPTQTSLKTQPPEQWGIRWPPSYCDKSCTFIKQRRCTGTGVWKSRNPESGIRSRNRKQNWNRNWNLNWEQGKLESTETSSRYPCGNKIQDGVFCYHCFEKFSAQWSWYQR